MPPSDFPSAKCPSAMVLSFAASGLLYSPALNRHATAAADNGGLAPPSVFKLYRTPELVVQSLMYLTPFATISFGTGTPAFRQLRRPCICVIVTEPSSKPNPSAAVVYPQPPSVV